MSLFESPEILDSCNILGFNLLFKFIWQITEEVDARFVFQGLDVHHIVAQLIALVEKTLPQPSRDSTMVISAHLPTAS